MEPRADLEQRKSAHSFGLITFPVPNRMEWKLFETFQSPVDRGAPLRPSNRRLDFFEGEPSQPEVAICVFGQPNCFHLLKGRLLIGFHSPNVNRYP